MIKYRRNLSDSCGSGLFGITLRLNEIRREAYKVNDFQVLCKSIIYRDVIARNKISGERKLLGLVHFLAGNTAKRYSYSSLAKTVGIKHNDTVKAYMDALEQTYMIAQVRMYDPSVKKQLFNNKKVYFIDTAFASRIGFNPTDNYGQQLENMVYTELCRRGAVAFQPRHAPT